WRFDRDVGCRGLYPERCRCSGDWLLSGRCKRWCANYAGVAICGCDRRLCERVFTGVSRFPAQHCGRIATHRLTGRRMAIPISYNIRNLRLRKGATVMTALGIALTVTIVIFIIALLAALRDAFATTGEPNNVLVLRKGSNSELAAGGVEREAMQVLRDLPGLARDAKGENLVSGEDILVIVLPRKDGTGETNVTIRTLSLTRFEMRQ